MKKKNEKKFYYQIEQGLVDFLQRGHHHPGYDSIDLLQFGHVV